MAKSTATVQPVPSCCCPERRAFLAGAGRLVLGAAAASSLGLLAPASAQAAPEAGAGLIDVHHHHIPPFYLAENKERDNALGLMPGLKR